MHTNHILAQLICTLNKIKYFAIAAIAVITPKVSPATVSPTNCMVVMPADSNCIPGDNCYSSSPLNCQKCTSTTMNNTNGITVTTYAAWGIPTEFECPSEREVSCRCVPTSETYKCSAGYYGTATSESAGCTKCPTNASCSGGNDSTFVCNTGYYRNPNGSTGYSDACKICPQNATCWGGSDAPSCNTGYYSGESSSSGYCQECPTNSVCWGASAQPQCTTGYYSDTQTGLCTRCPEYSGYNTTSGYYVAYGTTTGYGVSGDSRICYIPKGAYQMTTKGIIYHELNCGYTN